MKQQMLHPRANILHHASRILHPALCTLRSATIFFNFPQQSSVDNKLMLSAVKLLLLRLKQTASPAESCRVSALAAMMRNESSRLSALHRGFISPALNATVQQGHSRMALPIAISISICILYQNAHRDILKLCMNRLKPLKKLIFNFSQFITITSETVINYSIKLSSKIACIT